MKFRLAFAFALSLAALRAAPPAAALPQRPMTTYSFGLFTRGSQSGTGPKEEREKIQAAHLGNSTRLAVEIHPWLTMQGNIRDSGFSVPAPALHS